MLVDKAINFVYKKYPDRLSGYSEGLRYWLARILRIRLISGLEELSSS